MNNVFTPTLSELQAANLQGKTVAVSKEIMADLDTPVSAYLKIRGEGPSFLLESVEGTENIGRFSFLGSNPRRVLRVKDGKQWYDGRQVTECSDPLIAVQSMIEAYQPAIASKARFEGGALGYLAYEAARYFERLPPHHVDKLGLPDAIFMDVDTVLIFDHVARTIRVVSHVWLDQPIEEAYQAAADRIDALIDRLTAPLHAPSPHEAEPRAVISNMTQDEFFDIVRRGQEHIAAGDIFQIVLSQRLSTPIEGDPFSLYRRLRMLSPAPYLYYLDFEDHQLVGASPEILVQVEGRHVTTRPIAGTRRRGRTPEEDVRLEHEMTGDEKERAEHLMLVDLLRNDVGRVAEPGSVQVGKFMTVERFSHVMHMVSDVTGEMSAAYTPYDVLRATFPAGTVSGAPKIRAMEIIADLEEESRGTYAGAVGFINTTGDMEMAITIRTGVVKEGRLHVQVGAGIVADSTPEREFVETVNKARALLLAAGVAL